MHLNLGNWFYSTNDMQITVTKTRYDVKIARRLSVPTEINLYVFRFQKIPIQYTHDNKYLGYYYSIFCKFTEKLLQ